MKSLTNNRPRIRWKMFGIIYLILCLLSPTLLFGTLHVIGGIFSSYGKSFKTQWIRSTRGEFALDFYEMKENWKGAVGGMNPRNWVK